MKKIIIMLLLSLVLVGCSGSNNGFAKLTPQDQYKYVVERLDEAKGLDVTATTKVTFMQGSDAYQQTVVMDMVTNTEDDPMMAKAYIKTSIPEANQQQEIYINEGYMYINAMDMKMKVKIFDDDMLDEITKIGDLEKYDSEDITNVTSKVDGVDTIIYFTVNNKEIDDVVDELEVFQQQLPGASMDMKDVTGSFVVDKDGNIKKSTSNVTVYVEFDGEKMEISTDVEIIYNKIGDVTIELPSDLDSYVEY